MRKRARGESELRAVIAQRDRLFAEDWASRLGVSPERCGGRLARAEAIERGEPVRVAAWEIPSGFVAAGSGARFTLEPDGRFTAPAPIYATREDARKARERDAA